MPGGTIPPALFQACGEEGRRRRQEEEFVQRGVRNGPSEGGGGLTGRVHTL
jgi:hypothetical protein